MFSNIPRPPCFFMKSRGMVWRRIEWGFGAELTYGAHFSQHTGNSSLILNPNVQSGIRTHPGLHVLLSTQSFDPTSLLLEGILDNSFTHGDWKDSVNNVWELVKKRWLRIGRRESNGSDCLILLFRCWCQRVYHTNASPIEQCYWVEMCTKLLYL